MARPVYYIESPDDDTVCVAINPNIEDVDGKQMVSWLDTVRERERIAPKVTKAWVSKAFSFTDDQKRTYHLTPLDLATYNAHVRQKVVGQPTFNSMRELQGFFSKMGEGENAE
jgi:hypothetical protein